MSRTTKRAAIGTEVAVDQSYIDARNGAFVERFAYGTVTAHVGAKDYGVSIEGCVSQRVAGHLVTRAFV